MPKEEALQTIHSYVEQKAWRQKRAFLKLMKIPGLYRIVPATGGVWRIDMTRCPYHDNCVHYGCPELCHCFCDSDDITYDGMHPRLCWHRTKTLGRGGDCCDFCLKLIHK